MACAGKTGAGGRLDLSRYLLTLCNEELLWRESEKLRRYKKEARLPVAKTLNEYDFSQVPELNGAQFRQLCETTDWVDAGENVLLFGASGLGKSHLAAAIVDGVVAQVPGPVLQRRRVAAGAAQSQSAAETE